MELDQLSNSRRKSNNTIQYRIQFILVCVLTVVLIAIGCFYRLWLFGVPIELSGDAANRYHPLAVNLSQGNGFSLDTEPPFKPNIFDVPGYPGLLAGMYLLGFHSFRELYCVHLLMEVISIVLVSLTAFRLSGSRFLSLMTAMIATICPFVASIGHNAMAEPLAMMLTSLLIFMLSGILRETEPHLIRWLLPGVISGLLILVRVDSYPLVALLVVIVVWSVYLKNAEYRSYRRATIAVCFFFVSVMVTLIPWMIRNYSITKQFHIPGQQQYLGSHFQNGYRRWLSTWMFDSKYVHDWTWHASGTPDPNDLPWYAIDSTEERLQIEYALNLISKSQVTKQHVLLGDPIGDNSKASSIFSEIACKRTETNPFRSYVVMPILRVVLTWIRIPSVTCFPSYQTYLWKLLIYLVWIGMLILTIIGVRYYRKCLPGTFLLLFSLILSRTLIPLSSAGGIEPRYLLPALASVWIFSAMGVCVLLKRMTGLFPNSDTLKVE